MTERPTAVAIYHQTNQEPKIGRARAHTTPEILSAPESASVVSLGAPLTTVEVPGPAVTPPVPVLLVLITGGKTDSDPLSLALLSPVKVGSSVPESMGTAVKSCGKVTEVASVVSPPMIFCTHSAAESEKAQDACKVIVTPSVSISAISESREAPWTSVANQPDQYLHIRIEEREK